MLAASQFNESEFFIRYLAQEAGVPVKVLRDLDSQARRRASSAWCSTKTPSSPAMPINMSLRTRHATASTAAWAGRRAPTKWSKRPAQRQGAGRRTATCWSSPTCCREQGFRQGATRRWSKGLVHGILEGNRRLRDSQAAEHRRGRQGVQVERGRRARRALARAPVEPARRTSPSSPAPSTPPARSAASSSPRCWPTAA